MTELFMYFAAVMAVTILFIIIPKVAKLSKKGEFMMSQSKINKNQTNFSRNKNPAKALVLYTSIFAILLVAIFLISQASTEKEQNLDRVDDQPAIVNQPSLGDEDATVTMVEFGDYKCPACKQWSETVYPVLKEQYIDTGKMKLVYVNTLFHGDESELGAIAAEAVLSQNKEAFWSFHKAMFEAQPSQDHDGLWITEDKIIEIAASISPGIDLEKLKADMVDRKTLPQVEVDTGLVDKYDVSKTPTIMINGIIMESPFDIETIRSVLDQELGG